MDRIFEIGKELLILQDELEDIIISKNTSIKAGLYTKLKKIRELTEERHDLLFLANLNSLHH